MNENPNRLVFRINKEDLGKTLVVVMNPQGFEARIGNSEVSIKKEPLQMKIVLKTPGELILSYSPVRDLMEVLKRRENVL